MQYKGMGMRRLFGLFFVFAVLMSVSSLALGQDPASCSPLTVIVPPQSFLERETGELAIQIEYYQEDFYGTYRLELQDSAVDPMFAFSFPSVTPFLTRNNFTIPLPAKVAGTYTYYPLITYRPLHDFSTNGAFHDTLPDDLVCDYGPVEVTWVPQTGPLVLQPDNLPSVIRGYLTNDGYLRREVVQADGSGNQDDIGGVDFVIEAPEGPFEPGIDYPITISMASSFMGGWETAHSTGLPKDVMASGTSALTVFFDQGAVTMGNTNLEVNGVSYLQELAFLAVEVFVHTQIPEELLMNVIAYLPIQFDKIAAQMTLGHYAGYLTAPTNVDFVNFAAHQSASAQSPAAMEVVFGEAGLDVRELVSVEDFELTFNARFLSPGLHEIIIVPDFLVEVDVIADNLLTGVFTTHFFYRDIIALQFMVEAEETVPEVIEPTGPTNIRLTYDTERFFLQNISTTERPNISGLLFVGDTFGQFSAIDWQNGTQLHGDVYNIAADRCVQLAINQEAVGWGDQIPCRQTYGWMAQGGAGQFWRADTGNTTFSVFNNGQLIATCAINAGLCEFWVDAAPAPQDTESVSDFDMNSASTVASNAGWTPVVRQLNGVEMVLVPPGCFTMGADDDELHMGYSICEESIVMMGLGHCDINWFADEQPQTQICFDEPFWIDRYEVTNAQFSAFSGTAAQGSDNPDGGHPREQITWHEAQAFCALRGASLPSEAEWEYAASGPDSAIFPWGNWFNGTLANFCDSNCVAPQSRPAINDGFAKSGPVAQYPGGASWVGAYGMAGNVLEWTSTLYQLYPYDAGDGRENQSVNGNRVGRGGSWFDDGNNLRTAFRFNFPPNEATHAIGFRCALSETSPRTTLVMDRDEPALGTGDVQVTLRWEGNADIDLHVIDPSGERIFFDEPFAASGGQLDRDVIPCENSQFDPVENVFWPTGQSPNGTYTVEVHYHPSCGNVGPTAYSVTVNIAGQSPLVFNGVLNSLDERSLVTRFSN